MSYLDERRKHIEDGRPLPQKKNYYIPKVSKRRAEKIAAERTERGGGDTELQKFMRRAVKMFTGYCAETGLRTETKIFKYAVNSVAHILSRQQCKSVQYHPCNWMEFEPGFHVKYDKMNWEERERLGCWPVIREKLIMVWPDLTPDERRHFPPALRQWIESNEPFK